MLRAAINYHRNRLAAWGIGSPDRPWDRIPAYHGPAVHEALDALPEEAFLLRRFDPAAKALIGAVNAGPHLSERHFVPEDELPASRMRGRVLAGADIPIRLRLANFVSAADFVSWEHGRGRGALKSDQGMQRDSSELIRDYASMLTVAPALGKVAAYVQPNGMTLFQTMEGSHRTAAAMRRGEETIGTELLYVLQTETSLINLPR